MSPAAKIHQWVFFLVLLLSSIGSAAALNPHLNVTFAETVYQNVTFAKDFLLVENRTYSLIEGVLTVDNPGTETVFDTYVKIINTDNLVTNLSYTSGRNGSQIIFPKNNDTIANLSINITSSYTPLGYDVDEDGVGDSVEVNSTDIIFNITSEYQPLVIPLYNTSGLADLSHVNVFNTTINLTSNRTDGDYNSQVLFATLHINGTQTQVNNLSSTELSFVLNDTKRNYTVLHIPELRAGQSSIFDYNVSSLLVDPPLDINTTYTNPEFQTKVLAGQDFNITDTATNIAQVGSLIILNISIYSTSINVSNGSYSELQNFTLQELYPTGDYQYVSGNGTSDRIWYWKTNNGTIPIGQTYNISYRVRAPDTVPSSGTYPAIIENLTYTINATASQIAVSDVRSRAELNFTTSKQIIQPADNNSDNNVTWRSLPTVGTYQNISFTLEKVTLWVTSSRDPNQVANNLETTYSVNSEINLTSGWAGSPWLFNFTDGSSDSNPPPIVWIKPYWIIENTGGQILNRSITKNGTDIYTKYIYVVNGYWLDVAKNVTSTGNGTYDIKVQVHNRGNGYTPQNMTVTVYDFIPTAFTAYNFSPSYNNLSNVSGQFTGTAYQWDVGLRTNLSTSFAPAGDPYGFDQYYLNYSVNGTGDFAVSDLYIIGLDPRLVDNANAFEGVSVLSSIASTSKELVYLAIVVFLIAINIGNFLMTSRINKKLDKKE